MVDAFVAYKANKDAWKARQQGYSADEYSEYKKLNDIYKIGELIDSFDETQFIDAIVKLQNEEYYTLVLIKRDL